MRHNRHIVLGIDPGYDRLGVAVLCGSIHEPEALLATTITTSRSESHEHRLVQVGKAIRSLVSSHQPTLCALETLFFQKNRKTAMAVAEARGIIRYEIAQAHIPLLEISPQEVKRALTSHGHAPKEAVARMVYRLVRGVPRNMHDDAIDAVAVAVAGMARTRCPHGKTCKMV